MSSDSLYTNWYNQFYKNSNQVNSNTIDHKLGTYFINNIPYHNYYRSDPLKDGPDGVHIFPNFASNIRNTSYAPYPAPRFSLYDEGCGPSNEPSFDIPTALPYMNDWLQRYSKYVDNCEFGYNRYKGKNYYNFKTLDDTFLANEKSIKFSQPCINKPSIYACPKQDYGDYKPKNVKDIILQP